MANYNPKSLKAEEFINDGEILETLRYAEENKNNAELIDEILEKARPQKTEQGCVCSGLSHREASVLLACDIPEKVEKIKKIADILAAYPENDLLISGHTARAGTEESCQKLSSERAVSVADFLIILGVRDKNRIFTQGHGSKVPVASNKTEEGKAKNRRVEITLLDK